MDMLELANQLTETAFESIKTQILQDHNVRLLIYFLMRHQEYLDMLQCY